MKQSAEIASRLARRFPKVTTALEHRDAWQLLVATILSAQTTDQQVNRVTPELFRRLRTPEDFARADLRALRSAVRGVNFFRTKARNIQAAARMIVKDFGGQVPRTMDELVRLPGVARKTANVVLGTFFREASGIVVDTHVARVSQRLGLSAQEDPPKIEADLMRIFPKEQWIDLGHRMIWFGRKVCGARRPSCPECPLADLCPYPDKTRPEEGKA